MPKLGNRRLCLPQRGEATRMLNNGQTSPELKFQAVGGGTAGLPADLAGSFGVALV